MASDDKLTTGYQTRYREWELYVQHPLLRDIEGGGHYFTRTRPDKVAELIVAAAARQETR
ncbi:surfactin synthase thioesterase subunit [Kibdelosporangium banguiense]|uniref:Surfactin synthase thioesterase subunit n=1 Tax=Kibdelosporangium banguiense TaxID=1365924 RepID=A0ABS4TVB2_9PSEU|nr:hypothetical protein [Kibdelosporangium banguiense]MBP2328356.1 surfactin synthase thioesterase subunit [Kibdelosporangium banguiense]